MMGLGGKIKVSSSSMKHHLLSSLALRENHFRLGKLFVFFAIGYIHCVWFLILEEGVSLYIWPSC